MQWYILRKYLNSSGLHFSFGIYHFYSIMYFNFLLVRGALSKNVLFFRHQVIYKIIFEDKIRQILIFFLVLTSKPNMPDVAKYSRKKTIDHISLFGKANELDVRKMQFRCSKKSSMTGKMDEI